VPADDKPNTRLLVSAMILSLLESLKLSYPTSSPEHRAELLSIHQQLAP
jgi:hypothetical protein